MPTAGPSYSLLVWRRRGLVNATSFDGSGSRSAVRAISTPTTSVAPGQATEAQLTPGQVPPGIRADRSTSPSAPRAIPVRSGPRPCC